MSQIDQLLVFASVVLSNDFNWMPACLLLLHECAHVLQHVALVNKECALLEVDSFFSQDVPHGHAAK
jgi:hypothetical protein